MPDLSGTQVVIVCEGPDDYDFARGYLRKLGVKRFVPRVNPKGKGAGNAWTVGKFAEELKEYRARRTLLDLVLVALADGDGKTPAQEKRRLEDSQRMRDLGQQPRRPGERAVIVVPMRHIEAWFWFVESGSCDESEENEYKNRYRGDEPKKPTKWGGVLADRCRTASPVEIAAWPTALQDACQELARL
jgi:hypothetical protein